jgi:surface polysaccharide O-acyltransferase-like enzyme
MFLLSTTFCKDTAEIWQVVGKILFIFKIVIPLLIIIFGMIDLGKAVVASKDDEIKKAAKQLLMRILAGIIIFFIPVIVSFAFTLADGFDSEGDYSTCEACITNPNGC